jgi:hypothetical protein
MVSNTILYYNIKILWDHGRICGPSLTEKSLCGAYLYNNNNNCNRMVSNKILYYNSKILWDHSRICGPSLTETSLRGAYLYNSIIFIFSGETKNLTNQKVSSVTSERR